MKVEELQDTYAKSAGLSRYGGLAARHEYDYAQAGQVIAGLRAGLDAAEMQLLSDPLLDDAQMFLIRCGLEKWDVQRVSVYARAVFRTSQMREIMLCLEAGLDAATVAAYLTPDIPAKAMASRRYALLLGNGYITFSKAEDVPPPPVSAQPPQEAPLPELTRDQYIIVNRAKESGLDGERLAMLADRRFSPAQMEQILWGFEQNRLTAQQAALFANPLFEAGQMTELRKSIKDKLPAERLAVMANPKFTARQLTQLRLASDLTDEQFAVIARPDFPAYRINEFTLGYRQGYSTEQLLEME